MSFLGDFINGKFVKTEKEDGQFKDISPSDFQDQIMTVTYRYDHIDQACEHAKKAYLPWARLGFEERKKYLLRLKDIFESEREELAKAISRDTGKPLWESRTEVSALVNKIDITLNYSYKLVETVEIPNALPSVSGFIRYKPRGVMAVIGPFNFPVHLPNGHIIPALAMGNTVVFKPSEQTPFAGQVYARCFERAEFPPGVFNMIQGEGEFGRKLVLNENVDGILFTGSYEVGLRIKQETIAHYWKILVLEMGGKNTTIVWEDADFNKAVYESLVACYLTAGQRCATTSRIIVHPKIAEQFTEKFYQAAKKLKIGHWATDSFMGPLINQSAVEKYLRFQEIAKRENCESMMRGKVLDMPYKGHYVTPSINLVKTYDSNSVYQKSEIFGPNVAIYQSSDFDEALQISNSTGYGLVMALFTQRRDLYEKALLEAKVGVLNFNRTSNGASSKLPFGGMGKSGNDRPSAHFAIEYCSVSVASLEDSLAYDSTKNFPGLSLE